jgi:hypothetical protein
MTLCTCRTTSSGDTIICDPCASIMLEALNDLLPNDSNARQLPSILTPVEYQGMTFLVNGWLDTLEPNQQQQRGGRR